MIVEKENSQILNQFIIDRLIKQYGKDITDNILSGYIEKMTTLRVNTLKSNIDYVTDILTKNNINFETVDWYQNALIIKNNSISLLDLFKDGEIYLQNLSTMLPPLILQPSNNTDILDMTAAPGGKTTFISALAPKSRITACEQDKIRFEKLKYNINLQGVKNCSTMLIDSTKIEDYYKFDSILLDAPCSGSGTINLFNPKTYKNISEKLLNNLPKLQKKLLEKAINISKKDSIIVYSTCSILSSENEDIILDILKTKKVELIKLNNDYNLPLLPTKIDGTLCIRPTNVFEGFFVCKLRKL